MTNKQNRATVRFIIICAMMLCFFAANGSALAQDIAVKTYLDQTTVATGQQFTLTVEVSGVDAQSAPTPDPPDISSFADYMGSSTSQNIQVVNGRMSVSKSSVNYYVARVEGTHRIPRVQLNFRGKTFQSDPISLTIVKGSAVPPSQQPGQPPSQAPQNQVVPQGSLEGNLFLKAEVDRKTVYPNQPVNLVYKIYTRVDVSNYAISRLPEMLGFWTEEYSIPQRPVTYEQVINGKRFLVAEIKKMALFPTDAGDKTIKPMEIECEVRLRDRRRSNDVFDRFFDDDFFGGNLFGRRVRTKLESDSVKIDVKALPASGKPANFSGMVGNFTMDVSLDKKQVSANEAITMKVQYSGNGNVKMLPEPNIIFPADIETYEPKVNQNIDRSGNGINGQKTYEYVLIPRYAGEYRIKPISFSYFDPDNAAYRTIRSPEYVIKVTPGAGSSTSVTSGLSREEIKFIGKDIRFIKQNTEQFRHIGEFFYQSVWFKLLLGIPLLALGGAYVYRQKQDKMAGNVAYARNRRANQVAKKRLAQANKLMKPETQKQFYAEVSGALMGFIADKFNRAAAGLNSDEIEQLLADRSVDDAIVTQVLDCLKECDFQRFAPADSSQQDMNKIYELAKTGIVNLEKTKLK